MGGEEERGGIGWIGRESGGEVISREREWGYGDGWMFREKKRK